MRDTSGAYKITIGLTIVVALIAFISFVNLDQTRAVVVGFFVLAFGSFTTFLLTWALSLSGTEDEKGKGKKAFGGLIGHFIGSLGILLGYFFLYYRGSLFEVWIALITYVISFVVFVVFLSRME